MFCRCECNFHPDICCHLQLLEDVEERLSCAVFEEYYLSRRLNCECFTIIVLMSGLGLKTEWVLCDCSWCKVVLGQAEHGDNAKRISDSSQQAHLSG